MARAIPTPRVSHFMGMREQGTILPNGTWLEDESMCYPGGGMHRRARALCDDGKLRVFRCGLPDTYFSIPVKGGKGYLTMREGWFIFRPYTK